MTRRTIRLARGWAGAGAATVLAAASHVIGGGEVPNLLVSLFALAISGVVCVALAGKVLSWWRLGVAVALSQGLYHGLFALAGCAPNGAGSSVTMVGGQAGHAGHGGQLVVDSTSAALSHGGNSMLFAHAVAAVLTILILRRGEVAGVVLLDTIALKVRTLFAPIAPVSAAPAARVRRVRLAAFGAPKISQALEFFATAHPHRGPPAPLAAI